MWRCAKRIPQPVNRLAAIPDDKDEVDIAALQFDCWVKDETVGGCIIGMIDMRMII
jgi:hypothetical protein